MVGSFIAMALFDVATVGALGAAGMATAFAINFAVSQIVTRIFGQSQQGPQDSGTREQVPPSNTNAIPIVYGDAYLGGTFVDAVLTTNQKRMYYVLAVSCISPNGQFSFDQTDMYYGDRKIVFDLTEPGKVAKLVDQANNEDQKVAGSLFIYLFTSSASGVITAINSSGTLPSGIMSVANGVPSGSEWASSGRQMNGLAFAIVVLNYSTDAGTTSLSPVTFKVSQTLNGTGVAKPGDVWYDYITNKQYGGGVGWMPDGSFNSSFVDTASVAALNTYSDELITYTPYGGGSSTIPRYRMNGVLDAGQPVLSNLDKIMSCCDSWMAYNAAAGQWTIAINKAETAAYAFNDNNIIGEIRVSATDITQSINQIEAKYPNGSARDQPDFVNLQTQTALLYPNEPINKYSITYDLINDSVRAQYLANRILEQAREDLIVSFSTTYYGIQVDAGTVVSVTNSDYGWTNKLFRVVKVNEASLPDGSLGARLEMTEYSAAVYDNFSITQYAPVPNSNLPSPTYFSALTAPTVTASRPTASIPSFDVQVTVPTTGRVTYGILFYTTTPLDSTSWLVLATASTANNEPVTPGVTYTFANQTLPTGTYYFSYLVGNEISQSARSAASASFSWTPTGMTGPTGPTGTNGTAGNSFRIAYYTQSQSLAAPSVSPNPTTGSTSFPTSVAWAGTITSPAAGQSLWAIDGTYVASTNQTTWSVPYLTQGIPTTVQSDNYVLNTSGWQIQRDTGDAFFNNGTFRGNVVAGNVLSAGATLGTTSGANFWLRGSDGAAYFGGTTTIGGRFSVTGVFTQSGIGDLTAYLSSNAGGSTVYAANSGSGSVIYANQTGTGSAGLFYNTSTGAFGLPTVMATNYGSGAAFKASSSGDTCTFTSSGGGYAFIAYSAGATGASAFVQGDFALGYSNSRGTPWVMKAPSTSMASAGTYYLNGDGNWYQLSTINAYSATYASYLGGVADSGWTRIFATNSGTANAAGAGINLLGSTSTGIAGAYVGTSGTSNIVTFTVQTSSPSDIRLKEEVADTDLGLAFVKKLRPVSYKLIADPKHQKGYGFIADEVEQIIGLDSSLVYHEPDWKVGDEIGFKTIHYPSYIAVLTKAIQELSAQVEDLKKQISKV